MSLNDVYQVVNKFCKEFGVSSDDQKTITEYVEKGVGRANVKSCLDIICNTKKLAGVCKPVVSVIAAMERDSDEFKAAFRFWEYLALHVEYDNKYRSYQSDFWDYYEDIRSYGLGAKETLIFMAIKSDKISDLPENAYSYGHSWSEEKKLANTKAFDELYKALTALTPDEIKFDRRLNSFFIEALAPALKAKSHTLGSIDDVKDVWENIKTVKSMRPVPGVYNAYLWPLRNAVTYCFAAYIDILTKQGMKGYSDLIADGENVFTYAEMMEIFNDHSYYNIRDAFKAMMAVEDVRHKLFTKENIAKSNDSLTYDRFEEAYNACREKTMLFYGLCFSPCRKVSAFCSAELDKRRSELEPELRKFAGEQTLPKYNATLVSALFGKWDDQTSTGVTFASLKQVEEYAAKQKLTTTKLLDKFDYSVTVYGRDKRTVVSETALKVFLDKYFSMKDIYRNRTCDGMVAHFDKASFRQFLDSVYATWEASDFDNKLKAAVIPYIFYTSNAKLYNLRKQCVTFCDAGRHTLAANIIRIIALNGGKYALMLVDGISNKFPYPKAKQVAKNAMAEAAEKYNIPVDMLADLIIPDCGFGSDGRRTFGKDITLTLLLDGDVRIERGEKVLKSLPSDVDAEDKKEFSALKKEIKSILKLQTVRFERALMFGRSWKYKNFERSYVKHPVMRLLITNLVWGCYSADGELLKDFRIGLDGSVENCDYDAVELNGDDIIALVHPCDLTKERIAAWLEYIADNDIKQPFVQIVDRVCYPLRVNEKDKFIDLCEYPFNSTHAQRIAKKYDMLKTEALDAGMFDGYYLEDEESGIGVEIDMDGLFFYVDPTEGKNLTVKFYFTNSHDKIEFVHPNKIPTRLVSSILSALAAMMPAMQFNPNGAVVKNTFNPYDAGDVDIGGDDESDAADEPSETSDERLQPTVDEKPVEEKPVDDKADEEKVGKAHVATAAIKAQSTGAADLKEYLEFVEGISSKFWQIEVRGDSHTVLYGRIGTEGREVVKTFTSPQEAASDAKKLIDSKIKKGYTRK